VHFDGLVKLAETCQSFLRSGDTLNVGRNMSANYMIKHPQPHTGKLLGNRPGLRSAASELCPVGYDLFVAAPMAAFSDRLAYESNRKSVLSMINEIVTETGINSVYYAGMTIGEVNEFDPAKDALEEDLGSLLRSKMFLLVYPNPLPTGALVELGYAMALRLPVGILVREHSDLVYFMRHIRGKVAPSVSGPVCVLTYGDDRELGARAIDALSEVKINPRDNRISMP